LNAFLEAEAKVAMLSYSSFGSANSEMTQKVIHATKLAREKAPLLLIEGELQVDSAIIPSIAQKKVPDSKIHGNANVLIFQPWTPETLAINWCKDWPCECLRPHHTRPRKTWVNDLSRGASAEDILGVVAITAVQAQGLT
jgi:phosphate acetyltransferase